MTRRNRPHALRPASEVRELVVNMVQLLRYFAIPEVLQLVSQLRCEYHRVEAGKIPHVFVKGPSPFHTMASQEQQSVDIA